MGRVLTFITIFILILDNVVGYSQTECNCDFKKLKHNDINKNLSSKDIKEDINQFIKIFEEVHPTPYLFISREQFQTKVDELSNKSENMTRVEFWMAFRKLTAALGFQDLKIASLNEETEIAISQKKKFFPYRVILNKNNQLEVNGNFYESPKDCLQNGTIISKINGKNADSLYRAYMEYKGGPEFYKKQNTTNWFQYLLYLDGIFDSINLELVDGKKLTIEGYMDKNPQKWGIMQKSTENINNKELINSIKPPEDYINFRYIENVAYLRFNSLDGLINPTSLNRLVDQVFEEIKKKKTEKLILDFRDYEGKDATMSHLIQKIAKSPFKTFSGLKWKISPTYIKSLKRNWSFPKRLLPIKFLNSSFKNVKKISGETNMYFVKNRKEIQALPSSDRFNGQVVCLINEGTTSFACTYSAVIKDYQFGLLLGSKTGSYPNNFSRAAAFQLKNSLVKFSVPSALQIRHNSNRTELSYLFPNGAVEDSSYSNEISTDKTIIEALNLLKRF
ncbi:MAG: hypothetical protein JNK41_00490 [Saprospiraceae bacterium]|nr:hypothetical protein [Saprospiraceae bacterium]